MKGMSDVNLSLMRKFNLGIWRQGRVLRYAIFDSQVGLRAFL